MPRTRINREVEIGSIKPFGGNAAPSGFLICDGSIVSRTQYAKLFAAIGVSWGEGDGSTTFHTPDLRGRFLRGRDSGAGRDPDAGSRAAANVGGSTGDNVGSVQGDATAQNGLSGSAVAVGDHVHTSYINYSNGGGGVQYNGAGISAYSAINTGGGGAHGHTVNLSGSDLETRSINANVNYIIKAQ